MQLNTLSNYLAVAALFGAALIVGLTVFLVIQRAIYKEQFEGIKKHEEIFDEDIVSDEMTQVKILPEEMFDWKADEFERTFKFRFVVPTIMIAVLCVTSISLSIMSVVFK